MRWALVFGMLIAVVVLTRFGLHNSWQISLLGGRSVNDGSLESNQNSNTSGANSTGKFIREFDRLVAVAHVDVEDGVIRIYPSKAGRVTEVHVHESQEVEANASLFTLEDKLEAHQVKLAEIEVEGAELQKARATEQVEDHQRKIAAAQAEIPVLERKAESARLILDKAKRFQGISGVPEDVQLAAKQVEEVEAAIRAAKARITVLQEMDVMLAVRLAELAIRGKQQQLETARFVRDQAVVRAPSAGKLLRVQVQVGEGVSPTSPRTPMLFVPKRPLLVRAELDQEFAWLVRVGQNAKIQDDSTGRGSWRGKVIRLSDWYSQRRSILPEPMQFNDVRTLECIIQLEDSKGLRIGQRVRVMLGAEE